MAIANSTSPVGHAVALSARKALLGSLPVFSGLAAVEIEQLAIDCVEERHPAGAVVILEGHAADRFAVIVSGRAEVSILDANGNSVTVAELTRGESFGETALLEEGAKRSATVVALKPLRLLTLEARRFRRMLAQTPGMQNSFEQIAETIAVSNFLKVCTPFGALRPHQARALGQKLGRVRAAPGEVIVEQGASGSRCYLIRSGQVEVILRTDGRERRIATLNRGALFGEAALLMDSPRNATVRAIGFVDLLELRREDLLAALGSDPNVAQRLFELLQVRGRPRQAHGVEAHARTTADGAVVYLLKNPSKGTYYKLAERGWFLWERLNGVNGMRELTLAYFLEFSKFEPGVIAHTLRGLASAGFLDGINLDLKLALSAMKLYWWQKLLLRANALIDWRWTARGVDPFFQRLYDHAIRVVFSRLSLALLAFIAAAGLAAFFYVVPLGKTAFSADSRLKWLIVPAYLVCTLLHEAAHAFTTKHFGRQVNGAGFGWYRFGPVAFIDTSDMWLGGKWERIAVTAAGPAMNLILAGLASLLMLFSSDTAVLAGLWQFAVLTYILVLLNLNPLLELDGYYLLMDWLERPNLRTKALAWLMRGLPSAWKSPDALRAHRVELLYGAGTLAYVVFTSIAVAISLHQFSRQWIAHWLPAMETAYASYILAAIVLIFFFARIAGELRGKRE